MLCETLSQNMRAMRLYSTLPNVYENSLSKHISNFRQDFKEVFYFKIFLKVFKEIA